MPKARRPDATLGRIASGLHDASNRLLRHKKSPKACAFIMLGRLRDAVADVRDAGSNATRWLGIDELAQAAAYAGSGNERWRIVGARKAVAEEPELECNAAAVECSISGAVRGHAALQALEHFAAARQASHARGEWSSAAAPLADAATARPRRWPLTPDEDRRLDEPAADGVDLSLIHI